MNREEFMAESALVQSIWPRFQAAPEEWDVWFEKLRYFSPEEYRQGIKDAYAESKFGQPRLADILDKIKILRRGRPAALGYAGEPGGKNLHDDLPSMRKDITDFLSAQQVREWREAILSNEPWTRCLEKYPSTHAHWVTLIHARAIRNEVTYPVTVNAVRQWRTASVKDAWGMEENRCRRVVQTPPGSIGEAMS